MPAKNKPELMRSNNELSLIKYYAGLNLPFNLTCSNYTAEVKTNNKKGKYVKQFQSPKTFAAFAKIKSDVKDKPLPEIDREQLTYFRHNFRKNGFFPVAYNVDLKSAYATVLHNDGYVSAKTFAYMKRLKKPERLACVGMLAAKKMSTDFINGEPVNNVSTESPTANFFYHAVLKTDTIMQELKSIIGRSYMFTWVDGIYFSDRTKIKPCAEYLSNIKMFYSEEKLENFRVTVLADKVQVVFKKDEKIKGFNLPHMPTEFQTLFHKCFHMASEVVKLIKLNDAETASTFLYENGITVIMSLIENDFFENKVRLILAVPADKLPLLEVQRYFKAA